MAGTKERTVGIDQRDQGGDELARFPALVGAHDIEDIERDEYAELFAGLGENDEEKVLLYRIAPGSQKQGLLCRLEPGTSAEDIPPRFGGGDYIIKRLRSGMIVKSARLFVEGEPKVEVPKVEAPTPQQLQSPAFDMRELATIMAENNRQLLQGLAQVMQPQQASSRQDMLQEMLTMKQIFEGNSAPREDATDILMKGIELARSITPPTPGEATGTDALIEVVKSFGPAIGEVIKQSATTRPAQQRQPAKQPQPQQVTGAAPQLPVVAEPPQIENEDEMIFKYYVGVLVSYAKAQKDPALYADLIADNLSDAQISELLDKPDLIGYLASVNPEVAQYRGWFEQLHSELKTIMGLTEPEALNNVPGIDNPKNSGNEQQPDGNNDATA